MVYLQVYTNIYGENQCLSICWSMFTTLSLPTNGSFHQIVLSFFFADFYTLHLRNLGEIVQFD